MSLQPPHDLEDARRRLLTWAKQLGASDGALPTLGEPKSGDDEWTLRHVGGRWQLDYFERGIERSLAASERFEDVAFEILRSLSQASAIAWARSRVAPPGDPRRAWFERQVELMEALGEPWGSAMKRHQDGVLRAHPFDDLVLFRVERTARYRQEGLSQDEAYRRALQELPEPAIKVP